MNISKNLLRDIGLFILISFGYSWPIFFIVDVWLVPMLLKQDNRAAASLVMLGGHMLGMLGPAIAAFFMWRVVHKQAPPPLKWDRPRNYLLIVAFAVVFWVVPGLIGLAMGDKFEDPIYSYMWVMLGSMLVFGWISGSGEEIGWCGYWMTRPVEEIGQSRALMISGAIRGLWHWPMMVSPQILGLLAGERSIGQVVIYVLLIIITLVFSNFAMGCVFGWVWYRTHSLPLVGWFHQWYDMARDGMMVLLVGYAASLWGTTLYAVVFYMIGYVLFERIMRQEGLTWTTLFGKKKSTDPAPTQVT